MLLSKQELAQSAVEHPEATTYLDTHPNSPMQGPIHEAVRNLMHDDEEAQRVAPVPAGLTQAYHDIPMCDGFASTVKIVRPTDAPAGPLIALCFGGGFIAGSIEQLTKTAQHLALLFGATVVNVNYRLAPEHPFPIGQNDCWDTLKWLASHASDPLLKSDPSKGFVLGGVSAGGAITACLSRLSQKELLAHPLTGQWLAAPSLIGDENVPQQYRPYYLAMDQNHSAPILNVGAMDAFKLLTKAPDSHPLRYAVCSDTPPSGQPRTYFQIDGMDPLRDDGLIYDEILSAAGVETKVDFYPGCPHGHFMSLPGTKVAEQASIDTLVGWGWLLDRPVDRERAAKLIAEV